MELNNLEYYIWHAFVDENLKFLGYVRLCHDICVSIYNSTDGKIMIICLVYVDDYLFFGNKKPQATIIHKHILYFESKLTKLTKDRY